MRRGFCILAGVLVVSLCLFAGFGLAASPQQEDKSSQKGSAKEISRPGVEPGSTPAGPGPQAVRGGVLRAIRNPFPKVLGYPPEQNPTDTIFALLYGERLSEWDENGNLIPVLAVSWEADPKNKTITYHLRKGVKFHDGTPFNAEACRWNLQLGKETGRLTDGQFVKSIDVLDEYTVRITCTEYSSVSLLNYGWLQQYSPTAFNKYGKEYLRTHAVGTGPFKLVDFQRDASIK